MDDMKYFAIEGHANTDFEAIHLCAQKLKEEGYVTDQFESNCINREKEYPTGILFADTGFAIPHTDSVHVIKSQICFASLKQPIIFSDMTDMENQISVELVFMLAMSQPHEQVGTLQNLMNLFQDERAVKQLKECSSEEEFVEILKQSNVQ